MSETGGLAYGLQVELSAPVTITGFEDTVTPLGNAISPAMTRLGINLGRLWSLPNSNSKTLVLSRF